MVKITDRVPTDRALVVDTIRARYLEIADESGAVRIVLGATAGGPAEVMVAHPFDEDSFASLVAGADTENRDESRSDLCLSNTQWGESASVGTLLVAVDGHLGAHREALDKMEQVLNNLVERIVLLEGYFDELSKLVATANALDDTSDEAHREALEKMEQGLNNLVERIVLLEGYFDELSKLVATANALDGTSDEARGNSPQEQGKLLGNEKFDRETARTLHREKLLDAQAQFRKPRK